MRDDLGDRMKHQYENRTRYMLPRRTYTVIRVDGKAFHSWTRGLEQPFSDDMGNAMEAVGRALCDGLQGAQFAYSQSDECSVLLTDFAQLETEAAYDGVLQKLCSISASIATAAFNSELPRDNPALFDSRVWTIPDREEVGNYFLWRQRDCVRNSILGYAQHNLGHKACQNLNTSKLRERLCERGVPWEELDPRWKFGSVSTRHASYVALDWRACRERLLAMVPPEPGRESIHDE